MATERRRLSLEGKLAVAALALAVGALFASVDRGGTVRLDLVELGTIVEREQDHVTPPELAAWIVEGRSDYRLLDLRDERSYAAYHVPTAEHVPLGVLGEGALPRNERYVLYSDGGIHAAQAWMLMRAHGYAHVYTLLGGLDAWKDEVLYPVEPALAGPEERARFERAVAMARFFGGAPRTAEQARSASAGTDVDAAAAASSPGPESAGLAELPRPEPPPAATAAPPAPRKKRKEGC